MSVHPGTTKVIKAGSSKTPFLLFFGNRKQDEKEPAKQLSSVLIGVLVVIVAAILGICVYAFLTGKLG
jgi:predicted permease